jgi:Tfp pilus assembly protein PilO
MTKSSSPKVFIILTAASLLASGGLGYWQWKNAEAAGARAKAMRNELKESSSLPRRVEESREKLAESNDLLTHLETGVSTAAYVPTMLQELQATGQQCGLEIIGVRPVPKPAPKVKKSAEGEKPAAEAAEQKKAYEELDVEVKVKGSFSTLMTFLQKLADFPKIVGVRRIGVDPKVEPDGTTLNSIESTVVIRVYVFQTPGSAPTQPKSAGAQGAA